MLMNSTKPKTKRIFSIPHFFKDAQGKILRNSLSIEELSPFRDENGSVREGRITLRISDESGNSKAFRLSVPEALELIEVLEMRAREQLRRLSLLNLERIRNEQNKEVS
jgi:hypothetical protein